MVREDEADRRTPRLRVLGLSASELAPAGDGVRAPDRTSGWLLQHLHQQPTKSSLVPSHGKRASKQP